MSAHRNDALKQYASAYGPLTVDTADIPVPNDGTGSMNRGHGRKEDADLCGIMKNVFNIR